MNPTPAPQGLTDEDPIVGHKTFSKPGGGYRHEPLRKNEADAMFAAADAAKAKRAADMPTEEDAVQAMWSAYQRLKELGWRQTCYGPTNQVVQLIEPGSSGIHTGSRWKDWPEKTWWIGEEGWPSTPCLFKPLPAASTLQAPSPQEAALPDGAKPRRIPAQELADWRRKAAPADGVVPSREGRRIGELRATLAAIRDGRYEMREVENAAREALDRDDELAAASGVPERVTAADPKRNEGGA